ncbi:oligopeptide ABC transporter substrate-binding protein OppA [Haemophilus paracuniculus]|uniref:Oligopeptide ABC transporter substrate-binding protein OppA n=1 Tax=Haemophilus paracuniculus TaxID=734 RepID=A0A1T0AQU4_9PAST|nr:ABC transporter substrate-binding protein [Haemophilus paracuniculus]OOR98750.1 oligopeptide ABC transporter substrate-binding protein OppA [Haemophilus paracuniculus]
MQNTTRKFWAKSQRLAKLSIFSGALLFAFGKASFAADVPAGTVLADKQVIRLHSVAETATLDPQKSADAGASQLIYQMFEGLVSTDADDNIIPGVAEHWEASPDFKTWTFYLRKDAKWSNGDPVTAHDFVYAWRRLVDPKTAAPYSSYLDFMKVENTQDIIEGKKSPETLGVQALDDYTFQVKLSESIPYAADLTNNVTLYPVHKATIEKYGDDWTRPENLVGNGAYSLKERSINEKITFKRNPNYWNNTKTVIEEATYYILTDTSAVARYRTGELDFSFIPIATYKDPKFREQYKDHIRNNRKLATYVYEFNLAKPPFDDVRVRKALDLAVERNIITDKILGYGQTPTFTFTPNYIFGGSKIQQPDYANWTQEQRNQEAKRLLQEAGYSRQNPVRSELLYSTNDGLKTISVAVTSMWKKNLDGMADISLKNMEWKTFSDLKHRKEFSLAFGAWVADYNEASTFLTRYLSNSNQNETNFKSEAYDQLVNSSYKAKTDSEREEIYAKAEAELDRNHPFVAIYHYAGLFLKNPKLKGYEGKSPQGIYYIKDLYLEK